jgi:hypothetical protein
MVLVALWSMASAADVDLAWQSRLVLSSGAPLTGTHDVQVTLWKHATSTLVSDRLAVRTHDDVAVDDGFFAATLTAIDTAWLENDVWVGVTVDSGSEMTPRQRLVSVPRAGVATRASGVTADTGTLTELCTRAGDLRFDTTTRALRVCDGTAWHYLDTQPSVLAYYPFDANYNDASGRARNLTPAGAVSIVPTPSKYVAALSSTGAAGSRATGSIPEIAGSHDFTLTAWFRYTSIPSCGAGVVAIGATPMTQHAFVRLTGSGCGWSTWASCNVAGRVSLGADHGSTDYWACGTTVLAANTWHHLAVTYDAETHVVQVYTNGALDHTSDLTAALNLTSTVWVGGDGYNDNYFPGQIDDVLVFGRVLPLAEITALMGRAGP